MTEVAKEVGKYLLAFPVMIVSYLVGNFMINWLWDLSSSYEHWSGPFVAGLQTGGEIFVFGSVMGAISYMDDRHAGVPAIIMATVLLTLEVFVLLVSTGSAELNTEYVFTHLSRGVNFIGWAIFGFICLKDGNPFR